MKLNQSNPKPIKSSRALSCVATLSDFFLTCKSARFSLLVLLTQDDPSSTEALEQLRIASEAIEDKTQMATCEVCCDDNAKICMQLGVYQEKVPHVRYFHFLMRKQIHYSGDLTVNKTVLPLRIEVFVLLFTVEFFGEAISSEAGMPSQVTPIL